MGFHNSNYIPCLLLLFRGLVMLQRWIKVAHCVLAAEIFSALSPATPISEVSCYYFRSLVCGIRLYCSD